MVKLMSNKDYNEGYKNGLTAGLTKAAEQYQHEIDRLNLQVRQLEAQLHFAHYEPSKSEERYLRLGKAIETIIEELK